MADFEFSFTFDEGNYENDFSGDLYDFENMWQDFAEELRQKEENEQLHQLFQHKLHIAPSFEVNSHPNERYI